MYWSDLVQYAGRLSEPGDVAEDLAQEAFVILWTRRGDWQSASSPRALLFGILRNLALKEHRRVSVRRKLSLWVADLSKKPVTPLEWTEAEELRIALDKALAQMPPRRREAFVLVRFHRLSLSEAAEVLGIATQTVANQVSSAVADLRRFLVDFS